MSKTDSNTSPAKDTEDNSASPQVGLHVSYKTTMIYGEASRYTFPTNLPEEAAEAFCHGVLREGVEIDAQPGIRRFVKPREIVLTEVTD